jgi:hypothetical protein
MAKELSKIQQAQVVRKAAKIISNKTRIDPVVKKVADLTKKVGFQKAKDMIDQFAKQNPGEMGNYGDMLIKYIDNQLQKL